MKFVSFSALACGLLWPLVSPLANAQGDAAAFPNRPVRLIVGFTPGSATDVTARLFAQRFSEAWNVPVVVENIPGAGGTAGSLRAVPAGSVPAPGGRCATSATSSACAL